MNNAQWLGLGMLAVATIISLADLAIALWQVERQRGTVRTVVLSANVRGRRAHR